MHRLRANLALVIWLAVFAAILVLWAGSQWRYGGITLTRNRAPANTGFDMYAIASEGNHLRFSALSSESGFSNHHGTRFLLRDLVSPPVRDREWERADAKADLGVARLCQVHLFPSISTIVARIIDIHYAFLALLAGFFTVRSWRKRRRRYARGFDVVDAR